VLTGPSRPPSTIFARRGASDVSLFWISFLEGVVVGDDDAGALKIIAHFARNHIEQGVGVGGVRREQHAQPVAHRDAGGHDQESIGEFLAARGAGGVQRLPGDEHGHHRRLAGAGGKFQGDAQQVRVGGSVQLTQAIELGARGHFCEPDGGLRRLDLTEEKFACPCGVSPVFQQAGGDGGD